MKTLDSSKPHVPAKKLGLSERQAGFICKHAARILTAFLITTAALVPVAAKLKVKANFLDLLPASHPSITNLKELMKHVGGTSFLIAIVESPDEDTSRKAAEIFSKKAASFKQINYVDDRTNVPAFKNRKLLFLKLSSVEDLKKKVQDTVDYYRRQNSPFYLELDEEAAPSLDPAQFELEEKVSKLGGFSAKEKDSYMQVILLKPRHPVSDFTKTKQLIEETNSTFAEIQKEFKQPVTLGLTGPYRTRYEEYKTIMRDLKSTGLIATILLVLINVFGFRSFRSILYAYFPLALGTIWIWAFTELTIGYLNLITAFLAALLFGMGGDYTYHILTSFEEDYRITGNVKKAIQMTYFDLCKPLWSSMWTTAVVFFAMIISQFEGFRHFGIIAGVGIIISFVIVLFVQPSLIVVVEKYFPAKHRQAPKSLKLSKPLIYGVLIAGLAFTVYSLTQISHTKFDYNFNDLQSKDDDSIVLAEKIGNHFGVHVTPVIYMTPNRAAATKLAQTINQYIDTNPDTLFHFAAAVTSHIPRDQDKKIEVLGEIKTILDKYKPLLDSQNEETRKKITFLEEQLQPTPFKFEDLPDGVRGQYEGHDNAMSAVFVYPRQRIFNGEVAQKFVREARNFPAAKGFPAAGECMIYADILGLIQKDTPIVLIISTIVVFLLVLLHFKRVDHALWVHAPLAIGCLWIAGMMRLGQLQLNFFNMLIIPSILGVGIDNGIYIFDRYKERRRENFFESLRKSLKGVLLASATNIAGFMSVMFASHQGMASMGKLGVFGFLSCLLSSVFFVPAMIEFFELKYAHLFRRGRKS